MKTVWKKRFWEAGGFLSTFTPLAVAVGVNYETYFSTRSAGVSLTLGGMFAVIVFALSLFGKAGKLFNSGLKTTGIIFGLTLLLEPVILNLSFLTGMLFLGEAVNTVVFAPQVKRLKARLQTEETVGVFTECVHKSSDKYIGKV